MIDFRDWCKSATGHRITADEIGNVLGISRPSVTRRLSTDGLSADEIIKLCRHLGVNPVESLVDLGHLTNNEAMEYMDSDGALVATADDGELALELAKRLNPISKLAEVRSIEDARAKKSNRPAPNVRRPHYDMPDDAVADSSPEIGGSMDDLDP